MDNQLKIILEWRRAYKTQAYSDFLDWLETQLPADYMKDSYGNYWVDRGGSTLFACHTDTIEIDKVSLAKKMLVIEDNMVTAVGNNTLGADDGVGVWIMLNMLKTMDTGLFCFFAGEEMGCVGSSAWVADHITLLQDRIERAVEFDRRGGEDIVTDMFCGMTASDEFAGALAAELMLPLTPAMGSVTDVAEMVYHVQECVNVSCGYEFEHSNKEVLDLKYATRLYNNVMNVDWDKLPITREAGDVGDMGGLDWYTRQNTDEKYYVYGGKDELFDLVYDDPDTVTNYLKQIGVTVDEILWRTGYAGG